MRHVSALWLMLPLGLGSVPTPMTLVMFILRRISVKIGGLVTTCRYVSLHIVKYQYVSLHDIICHHYHHPPSLQIIPKVNLYSGSTLYRTRYFWGTKAPMHQGTDAPRHLCTKALGYPDTYESRHLDSGATIIALAPMHPNA